VANGKIPAILDPNGPDGEPLPSVASTGFVGAAFTNAPNTGVIFVSLKPFEQRVPLGLRSTRKVMSKGRALCSICGRTATITRCRSDAVAKADGMGS
jgi:hypothetical protein